MSYDLSPFRSIPLTEALLDHLIAEHEAIRLPRLQRLWQYYRNALAEPNAAGGSSGAPAQVVGLPTRLTRGRTPALDDRIRRETVIENDIAWRIHTLVDFMIPEAPKIVSRAADAKVRGEVETLLEAIISAAGGVALWQDAALLASVFGGVEFLLQCDELAALRPRRAPAAAGGDGPSPPGAVPSSPSIPDLAARAASHLSLETVEAPRAIPLLNRSDYRLLDAYILHYRQPVNDVKRPGLFSRLSRGIIGGKALSTQRDAVTVTEIRSAAHTQRYEDGRLVMDVANRLGRLPAIHIQNLSQPFTFDGLSDVEPLIPLQDELNTRLSDRANRVTMQSFRMWLGKGIDGFTDRPIGPGQMWVTDNLDASIESFGGDADSPSERAHIEELRESLDKASGVTPAAAGHIQARIGNLTSENALRISLMGTIAKTKRKRITYGAGIQALCALILEALDVYGIYRTNRGDRAVEVVWADPLPPDASRRIDDALAKAQLGVPLATLRAELGYPDTEHPSNPPAAAGA
ncbi:MAG: phage portal protein [Planctomycetota bacterium]|nr:phage portal protein [Planctomycetota bacterium]